MFTNPVDYIKYYVDILKKDYALNDLKIDFHGFVGFLMNLFGWTNFDIKQYYDYLYKEGFLATADETKNLYLHASKHNYPIDFAIPATAYGNIVFDFAKLPIRSSNVKKREVILPDNFQISAGTYKFTTTTKYKFIEEIKGSQILYYCIITPEDSKQRIISSSTTIITAPFINFKQHKLKTYQYNITDYPYGTYSQYNLTLSDTEQISDLEILVQRSGTTSYESFDIKYTKAFETSLSKAIFLNRVSDKLLTIETGNGYHGEWIPNSILQISLWVTQGLTGNSLKRQSTTISDSLQLNQYDINNVVLTSSSITITSTNLIATLTSSEGGSDVLLGSDLRNDIVKWIETRENLINKNDFFNLFSRFNKDFNILFKKNQLTDNNFYLCKVFRDQYQNILKTTNHTYQCIRYDDLDLIQNKESDTQYYLTSTLTIGRYYYKIIAVDKFYESIPSEPIIQTLTTTDRGIILKWSPVDNAEYYKVYGRNNLYQQYWIVPKTQLTSNDLVYFLDIGQTGISDTCNNRYSIIQQINFPSFDIDFTETIDITDSIYVWKRYETIDNTYYIDNKVFWISAAKILYDDVEMTNVSSISELITNSWTIVNNKLYIRLNDDFVSSSTIITVKYTNPLTFYSPFIYKYNSFFNWFEGYFIFDNMIQYPIVSDIVSGYTPPIFYFNLVFDYTLNKTNIHIKSYQDISNLIFKIKVLNTDTDYITLTYNQTNKYFTHTVDNFISDATYILIECYIGDDLKFTATSPSFQQVYLVRDQVVLLNYYDTQENKYICNIPVISNENTNRDYLYTQIYDFISASNISQNRLESDSVQTRFLNTTFCDKYISQSLLTQQYDHNLLLPLNMNIRVKYNTSEIDFTTQQTDIELLVAEYLQNNLTGIDIAFYPSQIADLIHGHDNKIISVVVNAYDSYGTSVNDGIETIKENDFLFTVQNKVDVVKYVSVYWWWNITNGIVVELTV